MDKGALTQSVHTMYVACSRYTGSVQYSPSTNDGSQDLYRRYMCAIHLVPFLCPAWEIQYSTVHARGRYSHIHSEDLLCE